MAQMEMNHLKSDEPIERNLTRMVPNLTSCDKDSFLPATQVIGDGSLGKQVTPDQGNTVHLAAAITGCDDLVEVVLQRCRDLFMSTNDLGNLALHIAANMRHMSTLGILVSFSPPTTVNFLTGVNNDGDNPLDIATKNGHKKAAMFLDVANAAYNPNKEHKSVVLVLDAVDGRNIGVSNEGFTALDDAEEYTRANFSFPRFNSHQNLFIFMTDRFMQSTFMPELGRIYSNIDVRREGKASIDAVEYTKLPNNGHNASPSNSNSNQERVVKYMDPDIYRAITEGDKDCFLLSTQFMTRDSLMNQVTPQGNTILHHAIIDGCKPLVKEVILQRWPELFSSKNDLGNSALHEAAQSGHLDLLKCLVHSSLFNSDMLKEGNNDGDNPLHIAIKKGDKEAAMFLVEEYPQSTCSLNKEYKSPLYMAVELEFDDIVNVMIEKHQGEIVTTDPYLRPKIKSVVHAAITRKSIEILDAILLKDSTLINLKDEQGRTALSYAASTGYLEGVDYLLKNYTQTPYQADQNGFFPIHTASAEGHITIIEKFLTKCPDSIECLNSNGQNIIHVAAMTGKHNAITYMQKLKLPVFKKLINQRDLDGNTPLHLATVNWHPKVVNALAWDGRVSSALVNKKGLTALDAAEEHTGSGTNFSMRKRFIWSDLQKAAARAPQAQQSRSIQINAENMNSSETHRIEKYKDRVNTLLLVAILVATVTFAAGFTIPGGYNSSSDPSRGMATLLTKYMFHIFVLSDTIGMYSSIIVAVTLIWAQIEDVNLVLTSLKLARPLLGIALTSMSVAFMAGMHLVVSKLTWLANTVLIMEAIFLVIFLVLFLPLNLPSSFLYPVIRHLVYYPFYLLMWATCCDADDDAKE